MISQWKNLCLDNITFTSGIDFDHSFPAHFHEEYTIGVSVKGIQEFDFGDRSYLIEPKSIFLVKPYQMHAHRPLSGLWSFKTLYLSADLVGHLTKKSCGSTDDISSFIIQDNNLFLQFLNLHGSPQKFEEKFSDLLGSLFSKSKQETQKQNYHIPEKIDCIKNHLSQRLNQKLQLDKIAQEYDINKFQFIRQFRQHVGVTPNTYLTILRVEKARKLINQGYPIIEAALAVGFYDQSHFHHSFFYYTGITPGNYYGSQ
jgi:AraC-like DNA-binding protein